MHGEILILAATLLAAVAGGRLASRMGYPPVLGELIGGIILGPPLLGLLRPSETVALLGEFGVLLMMMLIGMHIDPSRLRAVSGSGLAAALGGFFVPAVAGFAFMLAMGRTVPEAIFTGLAMGVTSLATKSRLLIDLKILDTRIAYVLMVGALISDVMVLVAFSMVLGSTGTDQPLWIFAITTGLGAVAFALTAILIGKFVVPRLVARLPQKPEAALIYAILVTGGLLFAWLAELAGFHAILGSFVFGLVVSERVLGARLSREVRRRLETVSVGTLAPLFFVSAGYLVTLDIFRTHLPLLVGVVVLATVGKIAGTAVFYGMSGRGWREGLVIGAGMNGRGAVEIIVAELALEAGLIDVTVFSALVVMAIVTTASVPILLTKGVRWLDDRDELERTGSRRKILVAGAHPLARVVARLMRPSGPVILIDSNRANVAEAKLEGLEAVHGNVLDDLSLRHAGIEETAIFIAATSNPEVNLLAARSARDLGVPEVGVILTTDHADGLGHLLDDVGVDILPLPDTTSWDAAIRAGVAQEMSFQLDDPLLVGDGPAWHDGSFLPLVSGRGSNRRLASRITELRPGDTVVGLGLASVEPSVGEPPVMEGV